MSLSFVFPGQGSQFVGMGKELAENFSVAREVFNEVDEALNQKLYTLMTDGDEKELSLTHNTQPALMAVSIASLKVLEAESNITLKENVSFVSGHSLGEYSALVASNVLNIGDASKLLRLRGQEMQNAVPVGEGAMAALIGVDFEEASVIADQASSETKLVCQSANDNAPGQVVISGATAAINKAMEIAKDKGVKKVVLLPVSVPSHSPMMKPASDAMAKAFEDVTFNQPIVGLVQNTVAQSVSDVKEIKANLVNQLIGTVRWRESVIFMKDQGVDTMIELGAGKVLSGLARRIDKQISMLNVGDKTTLEKTLAKLQG